MERFLLRNAPCILGESFTKSWKARKFWQTDGRPNFKYLANEFGECNFNWDLLHDPLHTGHCEVPVADCNDTKFGGHTKTIWRFKDFIDYWQGKAGESGTDSCKLLYLKDWHFTK